MVVDGSVAQPVSVLLNMDIRTAQDAKLALSRAFSSPAGSYQQPRVAAQVLSQTEQGAPLLTLTSMVYGPASSVTIGADSGEHALGLFYHSLPYKRLRDLSGTGHDAKIYGARPEAGPGPEDKCELPGFGGRFDGESDFVTLPPLGTLQELQIDVWVKFADTSGDHPIMNGPSATTPAAGREVANCS